MRLINKLILILLFSVQCAYAETAIDIPVQEVNSDYGLNAWLAENSSSPTVSINLTFKKAGYAYDTVPGMAALVADLLKEGTEKYSANAIAETLEGNGVILSFGADLEDFTVHIKSLPESIDIAFDLLQQMLIKPSFDEKSIERIKLQHLTIIQKLLEDPNYLARRKLFELMLVKHPYLNPQYGTPDSLQKITRDGLLSYVKNSFNRINLNISVSGDITAKKLTQLLDKHVIDLPLITKEINDIPLVEKFTPDGKVIHIKMDIPQTVIFFGEQGIDVKDPDFSAVYLLNRIIGGAGLDTQLMEEIRAKRGLTYGIYTRLYNTPKVNLILGSTATDFTKVDEMISAIKEVLDRVQEDGISSDKFQGAKDYVLNSFILSLNTNDQIVSILSHAQNNQLGTDYINNFYKSIAAINLEDVNKALERCFNGGNLFMVTVGQE